MHAIQHGKNSKTLHSERSQSPGMTYGSTHRKNPEEENPYKSENRLVVARDWGKGKGEVTASWI